MAASFSISVVISGRNFSIFRKDRPSSREGGGVCILINNATVTAVPVLVPSKFESLELVATDIVSATSRFDMYRLNVNEKIRLIHVLEQTD